MKKVKLGEVATFINGYAFKPQDWSSEGKEIIRIQNLTKTSKEINYYSGTIDKKYIVEDGDILISWSGTLGVFQWCGKSAVLNQHIFKVVFDKMDIDKSYFKYVVEKGLQDAIKHTHGSTMKHLTKKYFDNIMVSYTNLREQQRIASELDLLSKLILRRQEQLEEFNILVKSRFNEMFGDPVLNEMGWEKHRLSKLTLKIGSGATPRGGRESYVNEGIALIRSMNVYDGKFIFKDLAYLTNVQAEKLNNVIVESDDVLLNITGASVSRCCIVPQNILPARVNQHVSIIRCKKYLLSPIFLNQLLITSEFKSLLLKIGESSGATRQAITKNQIEELYIPLPPLSLQNEFADFVAQVDKSQFACGIVIKLWRNSLKSSII